MKKIVDVTNYIKELKNRLSMLEGISYCEDIKKPLTRDDIFSGGIYAYKDNIFVLSISDIPVITFTLLSCHKDKFFYFLEEPEELCMAQGEEKIKVLNIFNKLSVEKWGQFGKK